MTKKQVIIGIVVATMAIVVFASTIILARTRNTEVVELKIWPGEDYEQVKDRLDSLGARPGALSFRTFAKMKGRGSEFCFIPGRYLVQPKTSTLALVKKLGNGMQDPIRITLGKYRTIQQISTFLGERMMYDSDYWISGLTDADALKEVSLTDTTLFTIFIPNTYEVYWSMTNVQLLNRMEKESGRFWNETRRQKAAALGLTTEEVVTLASIVEEETNKNDEKPNVASVYLNRLRKGMLLQADPTVKYAVGDFMLQRILNKHLACDNPYNTYLNKGLPPGPICTPSVSSIDAVLANKETDYIYFCAKSDFSGYHDFASTLSQHNANAARFHKALNQRGIK